MNIFSEAWDAISGGLQDAVQGLLGIEEPKGPPSGALINKQSNIEPIPVVYGERRLGGVRVFVETAGGSKNKYLYMAIVLCEGEVDSIGNVYINDKLSTDSKFSGRLVINKHTGSDSQTADSTLMEAPSWGTNHRLQGLCYLAVRLQYDTDVFTSIPNITAVVKGRKCYDPRTTLTAWTDNPAICLRDYLTNSRFGKGLPASAIDDPSFEAAADDCDALVSRYTSGPTVEIFKCNAIINTSATLFDNVRTILQGMRGIMPYSDGKYSLLIEDDTAAVFDFDLSNIIGDISIVSTPKQRRFNRVTAKFTNPDANWKEDSITWPAAGSAEETSLLAADSGIVLETEIQLDTTTDIYAARDLARLVCLASRNQALTVRFKAATEALECSVGDIVTVTHPTPGWSSKKFRVSSIRIFDAGEVGIELNEHDASIYPWVVDAQVDPRGATTLPDPFTVEPATALTLTETSLVEADGSVIPSLKVSWTASADDFVSRYELQWKKSTDSEYQSVLLASTEYSIPVPNTSVQYDVRVRAINGMDIHSAWATNNSTPGGDTTAPSQPTSIVATGVLKGIAITWTRPSDADYSHCEIWENTSNSFAGASKIANAQGDSYVRAGLGNGVTRYYWLKAVDFSGNASSETSSVTATSQLVDTAEIEVDATTIPVFAYTEGSVNFSAGAGFEDAQSLSITSEGEAIEILAAIELDNDVSTSQVFTYRIIRDDGGPTVLALSYGSVATASRTYILAVNDTPGSGTATYKLQIGVSASTLNYQKRYLRAMEIKR